MADVGHPKSAPTGEDLLDRAALAELQGRKLRAMLAEILPHNRFYARKFQEAGLTADAIRSPADVCRLPFTTKAELVTDQAAHPPYGSNLTYPLTNYSRLFQTSGTATGRPLRWLDTPASWEWVLNCWAIIYRGIGLRPDDRLFTPFSFGPFLGFWAAFEGAARLGNLCLPGGGMGSAARLRFMIANQATVVGCTPTYALHLAEVAAQEEVDLAGSAVRALVVAGEPGGSIPATRKRIEKAWGARVFDHTGMTEIGSLGFECVEAPGGVHLIESECIAEVVDPGTDETLPPGRTGELVLTNLGRLGSPLLRYRTGDLVRLSVDRCACGRHFARMVGGILGRTDEMIIVRGNNVYPSAIEAIVRQFGDIAEFRIEAIESGSLNNVRIEIEPFPAAGGRAGQLTRQVAKTVQERLMFGPEVVAVAPGSLPRFELKASRFVRGTARKAETQ